MEDVKRTTNLQPTPPTEVHGDTTEMGPLSSRLALHLAASTRSPSCLATVLAVVPRSPRWNGGRIDRPWGLGDRYHQRLMGSVPDLETVLMGKDSWFYRAKGRSYDTLREAFVGERLNGGRQSCGCISAHGFGAASIDCNGQLEFMREVMKLILIEMPDIDLAALCDAHFAGQRVLCEHYLWWLEGEAFVAHPSGEERQDRLMLTDEGCAALAMLEMTKPGSNIDMSPEAAHLLREQEGLLTDVDVPRFGESSYSVPPFGNRRHPALE